MDNNAGADILVWLLCIAFGYLLATLFKYGGNRAAPNPFIY